MNKEEKCPNIRTIRAGDESMDYCELTEKVSGRIHPCWLVSGGFCDEWAEIQKEWRSDAIANQGRD